MSEQISDYVPSSARTYYYRAHAALKAVDRNAICACGEIHNLQIHHIDEDIKNNHPENLEHVCKTCHSLKHPDRASLILGNW